MEIDEENEGNSKEHLFSCKSEESTAAKVFSGKIPLSRKKAEVAYSRWNPAELEQALEELEYHLVNQLIRDLSAKGLTCTEENYVDQISHWIYEFLQKAAQKKNTEGAKSKSSSLYNSYYDHRTQVINYGPVVNQFGSNPVNINNIENFIIKKGDK